MNNNSTDYWMPVYAALLGLASTLTPKQQQQLQANWRTIADTMEQRGDLVASYFLHSLAQDEWVEERAKGQLRVVK